MSEQTYRVIRGAVRMPRKQVGMSPIHQDLIMQGDLLPVGSFSELEIRSWLNEGRIERANVTVEAVEESERIRVANPFRVDPSTLLGKTMEDMVIMVLEIDEEYDTDLLADEQDAIRLLTSGWDPKFLQTVAPVNDRSRPVALALNKMEQSQDGTRAMAQTQTEMSSQAAAGLAAAKAAANAPEGQE